MNILLNQTNQMVNQTNQSLLDQINLSGVSPIERIFIFFGIILLTLFLRIIFMYIIEKKVSNILKTKTEINEMIIRAIKNPIGFFILLQGFYIAVMLLELPQNIGEFQTISIIDNIDILLTSFIILYFVFNTIDILGYYLHKETKKGKGGILDEQLASITIRSLRVLVVIIGILTIIQNFGYSVTSLLAGLGLGGLAFALAAQHAVGNFLGSVTILSDKPFKLGDWINVGEIEGTVEDVGFRATKIRRFDQALVIVPNSQFLTKEITNYSAMRMRRISFDLKLAYGTTRFQIKDIVSGIKKIIEDDKRFDRSEYIVRFNEFGENSLNIFVYCFTKTKVWDEYLSIREELNLKIMELLDNLEVKFAAGVALTNIEPVKK